MNRNRIVKKNGRKINQNMNWEIEKITGRLTTVVISVLKNISMIRKLSRQTKV